MMFPLREWLEFCVPPATESFHPECGQGLNRPDKAELLFQVTPLVADSPWIVVVVLRRYDFCAADFECYLEE
eukprot:1139837-Pelagomonas_calceolata.AAC.8